MKAAHSKVSVYKKIQMVMHDAGHIEKTGWNAHHRYNFTRSEDICRRFQRLMSKHGLVIIPSMVNMMRDGKSVTVHWEMTIVDTDSGSELKSSWYSEAMDAQDKGINKCATAAMKYFLLKTFLVPDSSEPDADGEGPIVEKAKQAIESAVSEDELIEVAKALKGRVPDGARGELTTAYKTKTERLKAELTMSR